MKRTLLFLGCCAALLLPLTAAAVDFNLRPREPGPGHRVLTYWWQFNGAFWELTPPEKFELSGGGEMRLQKAEHPEIAAVCRQASSAEQEMFVKKDPAARDAYFRTLLPSGTKELKLVSQRENPLPVNSLTNFEAVYSYELGGLPYQVAFMVNRAVQEPDKSAGATAKPKEDFFTAVVVAPPEHQPALYEAFQQLIATAHIAPKEPTSDQGRDYVSHGMLGR